MFAAGPFSKTCTGRGSPHRLRHERTNLRKKDPLKWRVPRRSVAKPDFIMPDLEQGLARLQYLDEAQVSRLRTLAKTGSFSSPPVLENDSDQWVTVIRRANEWGARLCCGDVTQIQGNFQAAIIYFETLKVVAQRPEDWRAMFIWSLGEPDFHEALMSMLNFPRRDYANHPAPDGSGQIWNTELLLRAVRDSGYLSALLSPGVRAFLEDCAQPGEETFFRRLHEAVAASASSAAKRGVLLETLPRSLPQVVRESWLADCLWLMPHEDAVQRIKELFPNIEVSPSALSNVVATSSRGYSLYRSSTPRVVYHIALDGVSHEWVWDRDRNPTAIPAPPPLGI